MTTVLGFSPKIMKSAVLVADRQSTSVDYNHIPRGKILTRKLWSSEDKNFCLGHSGVFNDRADNFIKELCQGKYDVKNIIKKGYFPQLKSLNLKLLGREIIDSSYSCSFILATRFNKNPKLYTCFPLGNVKEREWAALGSGYGKVKEYLDALVVMSQAKDYFDSGQDLQLADIIEIGLEAVRRAQSQDVYSQGLDLLVCTPEGINDHYSELGDDFAKKLQNIKKKYKE